MSGFSNPLIGGGGALVYPSIHSPNFVAGAAGWSVDKDGNAQFNDLTVTGGLSLFYSGTPAAGNLVLSVAGAAGTDDFGNAYLAGTTSYSPGNGLACSVDGATVQFYSGGEAGPWTLVSQVALRLALGTWLTYFSPGTLSTPGIYLTEDGFWSAQDPAAGGVAPWTAMSLVSGWTAGTDINGTSYLPAYKLLPDGNVALRGELITPSSGTVIGVTFATLPSAYTSTTNIPVATIANNNGTQAGAVCLRLNGNVQLAGAFGNSANVRLDSVLNVAGT